MQPTAGKASAGGALDPLQKQKLEGEAEILQQIRRFNKSFFFVIIFISIFCIF